MPFFGWIFKLFLGFDFKGLLDTILKNWKPIAIAIVLFFAWRYVDNLKEENHDLRAKVAELRGSLDMCKTAVTTQNTAIEGFGKVAEGVKGEFKTLGTQIEASRKDTKKGLAEILKDQDRPQTCDDSIKYLIETGKEVTWDSVSQ